MEASMDAEQEPSTDPDPRDARIAELEAELMALREQLWLNDGCLDAG